MPDRAELGSPDGAALAGFLLAALASAGVQALEREPELLRVYGHPRLRDWIEDSPWIELALTEAAHQEHPEAQLCIPGSYPVDRILELVRDLPRAFRTRAELPLPPDPPPGAPGIEGASFTLQPAGTVERWAVRALVRVRVQAEELREHLVWVGADAAGRPLPATALGWDAFPSSPEGAPLDLPEAVTALLEAEARRVAGEVAAEYAVGAEARVERERARLEEYLQALEGELSGQLPAGPARRLLTARGAALALREVLLGCLPEPGPWKRETLLGSGEWPFRRPGRLDALPFDIRVEALQVARGLPPVFDRPALDRALEEFSRPRLARLERQLERAPDERKLLEEARGRLEADHRERLADIERKCRLQVAALPVLLHALRYRAARFALRAAGVGEAEVVWDPLAGRWDPVRCPRCGAAAEQLWSTGAALGCPSCCSRCAGCGAVRPEPGAFAACAVCAAPACPECGGRCDACAAWACARHAARCPEWESLRCARCAGACATCGRAVCSQHGAHCAACERLLCPEHAAPCVTCERPLCPEHARRCPCCAAAYCPEHAGACSLCRQDCCAGCVREGLCATCRSLEPPGEQTLAALRFQLAAAGVRTHRLGRWKPARNQRFRVVTARAWPREHVFVLDEETGAVLHTASRLALLG